MIRLGEKVRDVITGYEGIATARVEYLTGCNQVGIAGPVKSDGTLPDTIYFDESRVESKTVDELRARVGARKDEPDAPGGPVTRIRNKQHPQGNRR